MRPVGAGDDQGVADRRRARQQGPAGGPDSASAGAPVAAGRRTVIGFQGQEAEIAGVSGQGGGVGGVARFASQYAGKVERGARVRRSLGMGTVFGVVADRRRADLAGHREGVYA